MKRLDKPLFISEVDRHRNDDCDNYDICLDIASTADWESFSCLDCENYAPTVKVSVDDFIYKALGTVYPLGMVSNKNIVISCSSVNDKTTSRSRKGEK